jgi:hypothetical protein
MEYDLHSEIQIAYIIEPVIHTADAVGVELDCLGFESLEYVIVIGDAIDGDFTTVLEESPDDGAGAPTGVWTAVPAANIIGVLPVLTIADTDKVFRVGSVGKERHQRLTLVEGSANTAGIVGAFAVLGNPVTKPVADQST